ncbi:MAG: beta strand repeat-containing protein, partial [Candidatus Neomarinimicrobiota bacterium]
MSEAVYNSSSGSGSLEASDFAFSISGGLATLSSSTPTSISASGNVYTLGIGLSGTATGGETLTVVPVANSIYDATGNVASTSQSNNTKTLNDKKTLFSVKKDGTGDLTTISTAITNASTGDTILVYAGTYTENIDYDGKNVVIGSLYMTTSDTSYISSTIIDGGGTKTTVLFNTSETSAAILNGFTIQNGKVTSSSSDDSRIGSYWSGGGITIHGSSPTIRNCIIKSNIGGNSGATGSSGSAGIEIAKAGQWSNTLSPLIENCIISNNTGDGIHIGDSGYKCDNEKPCATVTIKNSLIVNNSGIGINCNNYPQFAIVNSTIADNGDKGIYVNDDVLGDQVIKNSIIWNNTSGTTNRSDANPLNVSITNGSADPSVVYCNIEGGYPTGGTINKNPFFINASSGDYRLENYSPSIGTGLSSGSSIFDYSSSIDNNSIDINGKTRPTPSGTNPDMGAYENDLGTPATITPTVLGVTSTTANGTYKVGDAISIIVGLSDAVTVTGAPRIQLETGTTDQYATYASGTGNDTLIFTYTVVSGDTTADLDYTSTSALELNSGTIKHVAGQALTLTLASPGASGSLGANKDFVIDGNVPTVSSVSSTKSDGLYPTVGETIPITVTFSQLVNVTGTPQLTLETGSTDAVLDYSSGTGTSTLIFNYVIAQEHITSDLDYTSSNALALNSGTINDASGNVSTLTLATPGEPNSLGANKAIIIDTIIPTLTFAPADGSTAVASNSNITITFNKSVRNIDDSALSDTNVDGLITLKNIDENGTDITFDATINEGKTEITINPSIDFSSEQIVYVAISSGLEDGVNRAIASTNATFTVADIITPIVSFNPANGSQDIAANRSITLTFSEAIRNIDNSEISDSNVGDLISLKATNASGGDFNFTATINTEKTIITVDPLFDFSPNSTVYVAIGATVEDVADNAIAASSSTFMTGIPDVIGPAVSNISSANNNGIYTAKDTIMISIDFNEISIVEGIPQVTLETGVLDGIANYSSGSGTKNIRLYLCCN